MSETSAAAQAMVQVRTDREVHDDALHADRLLEGGGS